MAIDDLQQDQTERRRRRMLATARISKTALEAASTVLAYNDNSLTAVAVRLVAQALGAVASWVETRTE